MEDEISSTITSMIPGALYDKEKTLLTLRQSRSTERKRSLVSLFEKQTVKCEQLYQQLQEQKKILQEEIKQLTVDTEHIKKEVYEMDVQQNIIRKNIMTQKQVLSSAEKQFPDEEELTKLMEKVCSLKDGIGKKTSDLKKQMETFKNGILFYQKYLHCKVVLLSKDTLIITFDTSAKSISEAREFLRFGICDHGTIFQFLEMRPKIKTEQQLVKTYSETGDIQGLIVSFWNMTKGMNSRKVLCEKNSG